jgi:diketogulonate reductase-like aldo/keto reductase
MKTITTHNGIHIPTFMYGTAWKKEATADLVQLAVHSGFTAIDTANQLIHYNEALVGEALLALASQGTPRESLFLQTKFTSVSGQDHRTPYDPISSITNQVKQSFDSSLQHLHTEYVDSYVLHGPYSRYGLGKEDWEVWKAIEGIYQSGRAKVIGISNVTVGQLGLLCEKATVKPMVVQNRCYAALGWDYEVREICKAHDIIYQGFSLLTANQNVLRTAAIGKMAQRVGAGPMQIIFRFAQQIGMLPLTGTTNEQHMKDDLNSESFDLTAQELTQIERMGL